MLYDSVMYLQSKNYKTDYKDKSLLLFSTVLVSLLFYLAVQNSKYITIYPQSPKTVKKSVISLVITSAPLIKKEPEPEVKKIIKKVIKEKAIKKIVEKRVVEKQVTEKVVEETVKNVVAEKVVEKIVTAPIFDANIKASFIAGLYEMLNEKKVYPKMAKRRKLEGTCEVSFTLNKDGSIKNIFLLSSCGHKILDKAALKVVKSIEFYKPIPDAVSMASLNLNIPIKYSRN